MKKLNIYFNISLIIILLAGISLFMHCLNKKPVDAVNDIFNNENSDKQPGILLKEPSQELYLSSKAELQFIFTKPDYDWSLIDLSEGRSFVLVFSPKELINSPPEDLLPRVTIVEMVFKDDEMQDGKGWRRTMKWGVNYRNRILKEKYGEENVTIMNEEQCVLKKISCIHFKYKICYPVSGKEAVTDEYCFMLNNSYYIVQLSKTLQDVNNKSIQNAFERFLSSLQMKAII